MGFARADGDQLAAHSGMNFPVVVIYSTQGSGNGSTNEGLSRNRDRLKVIASSVI